MASFLEELWESIFIPGPTRTILVVTNASFAALQLVFAALLYMTYSIHFVILSILCAGLWWAINWFAGEIRAAQAAEDEAKRIREARREEKEKGKVGAGSEVETMDTRDDTEVDTEVDEKFRPTPKPATRAPRPETQSTVFVERPTDMNAGRESTPIQSIPGSAHTTTSGASSGLTVVDEAVKKRKGMGESTSELSTDSEWDKLSQDSDER